jgi:hypothetical protein
MVPKFTNSQGWETQYKAKLLLVDLTHTRIYYRQARVFSETLWDELRYFARDYTDSGMRTFSAAQGHDDHVMAWMIALKISDDENYGQYSLVNEPKPKPKVEVEDAFKDAVGLQFDEPESLAVDVGNWR